MGLLPKRAASGLPKINSQSDCASINDVVLHVKIFSPYLGWSWFISEYDPRTKVAYGYVQGTFDEWGSFSIYEFEEINRKKSFQYIELDKYFKPTKFGELQ